MSSRNRRSHRPRLSALIGMTIAWTPWSAAQSAPAAAAPATAAPAPPPAAPPPATPPPAVPPPVSVPAAPASSQTPPTSAEVAASGSPRETSTEVLRLYVAEDDAGALRTVQAGLERCDAASRRECPDEGKALLLRDLGIVQAGAYRDHAAAVAAFREALRLDPSITIPTDLLVDRVRDAFVEAGGRVRAKAPPPVESAPAAAAASTSDTPTQYEQEKTSRYDAGDAFLLVAGTWGGGSDTTGTFMSEWGGAVSGAWHVAGPLAVGARVSVAGTVSTTIASTGQIVGPNAVVGAAALVGLLPRGKRNTGYLMMGIGPDYTPELDRARTVVSLAAGVSFGGFSFGGMPAFIFYQGQTGGAMWLFVGWGNYIKD